MPRRSRRARAANGTPRRSLPAAGPAPPGPSNRRCRRRSRERGRPPFAAAGSVWARTGGAETSAKKKPRARRLRQRQPSPSPFRSSSGMVRVWQLPGLCNPQNRATATSRVWRPNRRSHKCRRLSTTSSAARNDASASSWVVSRITASSAGLSGRVRTVASRSSRRRISARIVVNSTAWLRARSSRCRRRARSSGAAVMNSLTSARGQRRCRCPVRRARRRPAGRRIGAESQERVPDRLIGRTRSRRRRPSRRPATADRPEGLESRPTAALSAASRSVEGSPVQKRAGHRAVEKPGVEMRQAKMHRPDACPACPCRMRPDRRSR